MIKGDLFEDIEKGKWGVRDGTPHRVIHYFDGADQVEILVSGEWKRARLEHSRMQWFPVIDGFQLVTGAKTKILNREVNHE